MRYILSIICIILLCCLAWILTLQITKVDVHLKSIICLEPYHGYTYKTCEPIVYSIEGTRLLLPKFYITDLASIPKIFWSIVSPARSEFMSAAILHDFLYGCHDDLSRKEIDSIFYNLLIDNGVSKSEALFFYLAVRMFGGNHFEEECKWMKHA